MEETSAPIRSYARKARFALYALFILSILGWIIPEFLGIGGIDITPIVIILGLSLLQRALYGGYYGF